MNAATCTAELGDAAAEPELPFIPAAQTTPVPFVVWGRLSRQAEVRIATDGSGFLVVQVLQQGQGLPFVAIRHEPAERLQHMRDLAQQLTEGVAVLITGRGFELSKHDGRQVLSPRICLGISLASFCVLNDDGSFT